MPVASKQLSATVSRLSRGNFGFCMTRSRFDTSSAVQVCSASLHSPDTVYTAPLPERSAPQLLIAAPSGGLHTLSAQPMRWVCHHLLFSIQQNILSLIRDTPNGGKERRQNLGVFVLATYQRGQNTKPVIHQFSIYLINLFFL